MNEILTPSKVAKVLGITHAEANKLFEDKSFKVYEKNEKQYTLMSNLINYITE